MNWSDLYEVILYLSEVKWREVSYGEVLGNKSAMFIRVTLYWGYLIVLWLFHLVCNLYCGCIYSFEVKWRKVKWVTVKFLGTKVPCILGWPYTEGTWLHCDYLIWCVSCTVVVLTCFVMCGWVYVGMFWQLYGCFGNMCTCIYCVLYCLYCVLYCFVYVYAFLCVVPAIV